MLLKNLMLSAFLLLFSRLSFCQNSSNKFYEVIKGSYVKLFFNHYYALTGEKCADYIRYTNIGQAATFDGDFIDSSNTHHLLGRGHYNKGLKDGYFEIYHPNEQLKCKGNYKDDQPVGKWFFYYENGSPEREIEFTDSDTLLVSYIDEKGMQRITNGNGDFDGAVASPNTAFRGMMAKGKVVNGKADGPWVAKINKEVFCSEAFSQGKFVKGSRINPPRVALLDYTDKSFSNAFFLPDYLVFLEDFHVDSCRTQKPMVADNKPMQYKFDFAGFSADLRQKLDRHISDYIHNESFMEAPGTAKTLSIQFATDANGKATDFKQISAWGDEFFYLIKNCIYLKTNFPPLLREGYFHLVLNYSGGSQYSYRFGFSSSPVAP